MAGRIIINRKAVEEFIRWSTMAEPPELALKALRRPFLNEPALYTRLTRMPAAPPWWLTEEMIEGGQVCFFDMGGFINARGVTKKWLTVDKWLELSARHRPDASLRAGRKWIRRLEHIKTFDEAAAIATREMASWQQQLSRSLSDTVSIEQLERNGEIVRLIAVADGRVWFELISERVKILEGKVMRNCLRGPITFQYSRPGTRLFSLRGAERSEQITLGIHCMKWWEARRRFNRPTQERDTEPIQLLLDLAGYEDPARRGLAARRE